MALIPPTPGVRLAQEERERVLERIEAVASTQSDIESSWLVLDVFMDAGAISAGEAWEVLSSIMRERF
ncbi:hypothetical protein UFOVP368_58 [uncultured Caudovirales phage]|uniref:Uncharacterized protein n=1 Tax=uncultured Caudovirales phage TaxID=2100421 RepID=A0A6J7X281_9CAUD|nr:hypothetical protein UFOVP368_58 [uncultured Caudovirales phage]